MGRATLTLSQGVPQRYIYQSAYKRQAERLLAEIDKQAQEHFERLVEGMKQAQGITEQLKAENQLEWIQRLNNIRACVREIVEKEIIYS